jgi:hypothetical protein
MERAHACAKTHFQPATEYGSPNVKSELGLQLAFAIVRKNVRDVQY